MENTRSIKRFSLSTLVLRVEQLVETDDYPSIQLTAFCLLEIPLRLEKPPICWLSFVLFYHAMIVDLLDPTDLIYSPFVSSLT